MIWESIVLIGIGLVFLGIAIPTLIKMCRWKRVVAQCVTNEERNQTAALTPSGYRSELIFEFNGQTCYAYEYSAPNHDSLVIGKTYKIWVNPHDLTQILGPRHINQLTTSLAGVVISGVLAFVLAVW